MSKEPITHHQRLIHENTLRLALTGSGDHDSAAGERAFYISGISYYRDRRRTGEG